MKVIFFKKFAKWNRNLEHAKKKMDKIFFVFEINASENVAIHRLC